MNAGISSGVRSAAGELSAGAQAIERQRVVRSRQDDVAAAALREHRRRGQREHVRERRRQAGRYRGIELDHLLPGFRISSRQRPRQRTARPADVDDAARARRLDEVAHPSQVVESRWRASARST
jgi:hypothetical protein